MQPVDTTPSRKALRKVRDCLSIAVFAVLLVMPWLGTWTPNDVRWVMRENRSPAKRPTLSFRCRDISAYPRGFEAYINDSFGFRSLLMRWRSHMFYSWLRMAPVPQVIRGRDGSLLLGKLPELQSYQRLAPYQPEQLAQWSHYFEGVRAWLAGRDCELVVIIIPNKSTVYPELMPAMLMRSQKPGRADQLITALRESGIPVVDPRESFARYPSDAPLYYRHDTHWTPYGADIVWRELLAVTYPDAPPPPPLSWEWSPRKIKDGDLTLIAGIDGILSEHLMLTVPTAPRSQRRISPLPDPADWFGRQVVFESDATNQKRAVVFHDSFAVAEYDDLLAANFSTLAMAWTHILDPDLIRCHDPGVVVIEIVERSLQDDDCFGNSVDILACIHGVGPAVSRPHQVGCNVVDTDSLLGAVRRAEAGTPEGWLLFGGYRGLSSGRYVARFRLRGEPISIDVLPVLDVSVGGGKQQLAQRTLQPDDFVRSNVWTNIDLPFEVHDPGAERVEMRVYYRGDCNLDVESVSFVAREE